MPYRRIDPAAVQKTIDRLGLRIAERFPARGLNDVCAELAAAAIDAEARIANLQSPWLWVRAVSAALALCGCAALAAVAMRLQTPILHALGGPATETAVLDLVSGVEAAVNVLILGGAGIFFVLRHEERAKRAKALAALHELRSLAHVVDMHQLTKDPLLITNPEKRTAAAPKDTMTPFELVRYLDYCAELLSLIAKVAALYAERVQDPVVIEAVNDIETMTTNLSRKIWQKISLVEDKPAPGAA